MSQLSRLLERQAADLATLTDSEAYRMLRALEDGRRELAERLRALEEKGKDKKIPFTAQQLRITLATVEKGIGQLRERLKRVLDEGVKTAREAALVNLLQTIRLAEPDFRDAGSAFEVEATRRLNEEGALLLHRHSVDRYGLELIGNIQRQLVQAKVQRLTLDQVADRIVATDRSVFAGMRHRAELIARMETMRGYDAGHQASMETASDLLDDPDGSDPLLVKASESIEPRNHPFSRVLDGRTRPVRGVWSVPASEVAAAAAAMGRRPGGILWPLVGTAYEGSTYPAHFNDRGCATPWRERWAESSRALRLSLAEDAPLPALRKDDRPTIPTRSPNPSAIPLGRPKSVRKSDDNERADTRENEAARVLAESGYRIWHLPEKAAKKGEPNPDFNIEGRLWDCYSPKSSKSENIWKNVAEKVKRQTPRVVLNLADFPGSVEDIKRLVKERPIEGLKELLVVTGKEVHQLI